MASTPPGMPGTHPPQYFGWGDANGNIPPILLRTFGYSRPILVALRSLSLKPFSFGYKTPPICFSPLPHPPHSVVRPSNLELIGRLTSYVEHGLARDLAELVARAQLVLAGVLRLDIVDEQHDDAVVVADVVSAARVDLSTGRRPCQTRRRVRLQTRFQPARAHRPSTISHFIRMGLSVADLGGCGGCGRTPLGVLQKNSWSTNFENSEDSRHYDYYYYQFLPCS